jgi:hypothetical protein
VPNIPPTICIGDSVQLVATGGVSFTWSAAGGFSVTGNPVSLGPQVNTNYTVSGLGNNGCLGTHNFLLNVSTCVGVTEAQMSIMDIHPNPVKDRLSIQTSGAGLEVKILDFSGRILVAEKTISYLIQLDLQFLPPGLYILKATDTNASTLKKLVKE